MGARRVLVLVVVAGVAVVQLLVPALALFEPRPARYGWQMYSFQKEDLLVSMTTESGQRQRIDPAPFLTAQRQDAPYEAHLAPHLCLVVDEARTVTVTREQPELAAKRSWSPTVEGTHRCSDD